MGYTKVIGYTENGYFVQTGNLSYDVTVEKTGFRSPKYKIGFFNKDLNLVWGKTIEPSSEESDVIDIKCFNDKAFSVSMTWDEKNKFSSLYATTYDSSGKNTLNKEIGKSTQLDSKPFSYGSAVSLRGSHCAFYALSKSDEEKIQISIFILDRELNLVSYKKDYINQPAKSFDISQMVVSEDGQVAILGKRTDKPKALSSKRAYSWFAYAIKSGNLMEFPLARGLEVSLMRLSADEFKGQVVAAGFFEEKESYVGAGIVTYRLSLTTLDDTSMTKQTTTINAEQNMRLKGVRNYGEGGGLSTYPIRKMIPKGDGGLVLVAESAYTTEYSYFDSFSQSYTRRLEYNFGDVVLFSLNNDGSIQWSSSVQKNQTSMDDGGLFSSYCMMTESQRLVFFFSEPINRKSRVLMSKVSYLGVPDKTTTVSSPEGTLLLPEGSRQVGEQDMIVPAVIKRKLHLIQISFD
ncbi:MAG: hypothetical protein ACKOYC_00940 [Bacteroidota bacterium]